MSEEGGCVWMGRSGHFGKEPDTLWLKGQGKSSEQVQGSGR